MDFKKLKENITKAFKNHMKALKAGDSQAGASLIEVLIAVAIIVIMMSFIGLAVSKFIPQAQEAKARNDMGVIKTALESYYLNPKFEFKYPSNIYGNPDLDELIANGTVPQDPWKNDYRYTPDADFKSYSITSDGQDGIEGTEDDIIE